MRIWKLSKKAKWSALAAIVLTVVVGGTSQALAGENDYFNVTTGSCMDGSGGSRAWAEFMDYTAGYNDDYVRVIDKCADGNGVIAYAYKDGQLVGSRKNQSGTDSYVYWDPYGNINNVWVGLKVCLYKDGWGVWACSDKKSNYVRD
ncbi:MAG: hypothetical protein ACRDTQ_06960 [Micromonosporaceae bacterium]